MDFKHLRHGSRNLGKLNEPQPITLGMMLEKNLKKLLEELSKAKKESAGIELTADMVQVWGASIAYLLYRYEKLQEELGTMEAFGETCFSALDNALHSKDPKVRAEVENWFKLVMTLREIEGEEE